MRAFNAMVIDLKSAGEPNTRAEFSYHITPVTISIISKGRLSVGKNLKAVLRKIKYWHQAPVTKFRIMARQGQGTWLGCGGTVADQVTFDSVPSDKGQTSLKNFQLTERRKLVDHGQELVLVGGFWVAILKLHFIGWEAHDHIDHDPHKRPQPSLVIWLSNDVEADRIRVVHQVQDPKIRTTGILGNSGNPVNVCRKGRPTG